MITFPNAKINLGLNVVEKRPDGYHNIETVFYPIRLQDALEVNRADAPDGTIRLRMSGAPLGCNEEDNLVTKAYRLLCRTRQLPAVDVHLFKHIPAGSGLGGGSADAAFMLRLLNEKFSLSLTDGELERLAATLGADCAFFVRNTPVFANGIGNEFSPVDLSLKGRHIVLVKPDVHVSTREAYAGITPRRPQASLLEIIKQPVKTWREAMRNDFEDNVFRLFPEIAAIKDKLYDLGATYASMSGSGSAVFGIFDAPVENVDEKFGGCFCRQRELD